MLICKVHIVNTMKVQEDEQSIANEHWTSTYHNIIAVICTAGSHLSNMQLSGRCLQTLCQNLHEICRVILSWLLTKEVMLLLAEDNDYATCSTSSL